MDGAAFLQDVHRALVAVISCFLLGKNTDWEALENMVEDPEWAEWRWCRTSSLRDTGLRGLSP